MMFHLSRHGGFALMATLAIMAATPAGAQAIVGTPQPFEATAIDDDALQSVAGREDVNQASFANQAAGVSRNSVGDNSQTGEARIDGNAFQNLSGLSILNLNTGNNVAINAAMNVNIAISPTP